MNPFSRVAGVFYEPSKVFADVVERPRGAWIVPVILSILFGVCFSYAMSTRIGWDQIVRKSIESSSRADSLTVEQKQQAIERGAKIGSVFGWTAAVIGGPLFTLIIAGILTGLFNALLGTDLKFSTMFSITAYAFLIRGLLSLLLMLIMYLKPPEDFDLQASPFSPGGYLNRTDTPKWLFSLATSFDLFTIWTLVVLAIGFSVASRKLSVSKCLTTIAIPWLLWITAMMTLSVFQ